MQTSTGETRLLSELRIGEKVLTMDGNGNTIFSEVYMFLDRNEDQQREFVRIETEDGASITATPSHLIYTWHTAGQHTTGDDNAIKFKFAELVEVGDYLLISKNGTLHPRRVQKITYELHRGVYAPLTYEGTIIVNSVTASCYALVEKHSLAHASFMPMRTLYSIEEWLGVSNDIEKPRGIHWYANALNKFKDIFLPSKWFYQT